MSDNFKNQRCSECYQTYSGLKATCSIPSCSHEHFFKKDGKILCVVCLMGEGYIKCEKCRKSITRLEELGKWRGNSVLVDDHTYDLNTFACECRECNHSENRKDKLKRCQGTFSVHYNGGLGRGGSTQFNQCDFAIPIDGGDFCQCCKGQTETYQQLRARLDKEREQAFEKLVRGYEKAQSYWSSLSSSEREREYERIVENIKLGRYEDRMDGKKFVCGYWVHNQAFWKIENGKYVSDKPHLAPFELALEFTKKDFGENSLVPRDYKLVINDEVNFPSPNPATPTPQPITNSNSQNDNSTKVNQGNPPKPNLGKDNPPETKNNVKIIKFGNEENNGKNNSANPASEKSPNKTDNETLIINLKNVKKITRTAEGNLVIEFNNQHEGQASQTITPDQISSNQELRTVKDYLEKNNQTSLSQRELDKIFSKQNNNSAANEKPKGDNKALLIGGSVGVLIIGIGIGLFLKRNKKSLKKVS